MANVRPKELTAQLAFRMTAEEKELLAKLAALRVQAAREAGYDIDPTLGAYLRHAIRTAAKDAGIEASQDDAAPDTPPKRKPRKGK